MDSYQPHEYGDEEVTGLADGWEEHLDVSTGALFYHNSITQETQWERPIQQFDPSLSHKEVLSLALDQILDPRPQGGKKKSKYTLEPLQGGHHQHNHTPPHQPNPDGGGGGHQHHQQSPQYHHQQEHSYQQHQQQHQQPQQSMPVKRTTVKIKSKKLTSVLKHQSSKIHIEDEPVTFQSELSAEPSSSAHSSNSSFNSKKKPTSDPSSTDHSSKIMPVGGKSQDYLGLVKIYNLQRPFLDRYHTIKCVLCQKVVPEDIFFPCEHKVVCRGCLEKEQVCPDYDLAKFPNGHCNCPLCMAIIKLILPNEHGKEVEKYWEWVLAVKPELPKGFLRDFRHSAAIIQKVHIDENAMLREKKNKKCCIIS